MPERISCRQDFAERVVSDRGHVTERIGVAGAAIVGVVGVGRGLTQSIGFGKRIVVAVVSESAYTAACVRLTQNIAALVVLETRRVADSIGNRFNTAGNVVQVCDDFAEAIRVTDQAALGVIVISNWLNAARIVNRQQAVCRVVGVDGSVVFVVSVRNEIAGRVVGIGLRVAGRIDNAGDAAQRIAVESNTFAV